jgi:hypothetical protein
MRRKTLHNIAYMAMRENFSSKKSIFHALKTAKSSIYHFLKINDKSKIRLLEKHGFHPLRTLTSIYASVIYNNFKTK